MIRSNSNSSARLLLAALLTGPGLIAAAVAADNYLERPTVASASEIFEKYPSKVTQGTRDTAQIAQPIVDYDYGFHGEMLSMLICSLCPRSRAGV